MKVMVPVKRVVDSSIRVQVRSDGAGVQVDNVKMSMNPFDEIALEQAVQLKEDGKASEVIAVSIGSAKAEETLRTALAMGADRALLIETDIAIEPLAVAKLLKAITDDEAPDLVIFGKQAIDDDANQTGQMFAALAGWPQGTFASKVEIGDGVVSVTREVDGGHQTIAMPLPAVITADLRLNQPRYASLPAIMRAKKKPLDKKSASDFDVNLAPRLTVLCTEEPARRAGGVRVASVEELVDRLKTHTDLV